MHLRYDLIGATLSGNDIRAEVVMKNLGVTYQYAVPQSMGDCWDYFNCENVPEQLPSYIKPIEVDPMKLVGYGLSQEMAEKIRDYKK